MGKQVGKDGEDGLDFLLVFPSEPSEQPVAVKSVGPLFIPAIVCLV